MIYNQYILINLKLDTIYSFPSSNKTKLWYSKKKKKLITSFVFHRWRWVGKWSDFGSDSKLSGNFIGSPSAKIRYCQIIYNVYMIIWLYIVEKRNDNDWITIIEMIVFRSIYVNVKNYEVQWVVEVQINNWWDTRNTKVCTLYMAFLYLLHGQTRGN